MHLREVSFEDTEKLHDCLPAFGDFGVFYSDGYLTRFQNTFRASPALFLLEQDGKSIGCIPGLRTTPETYAFYHPRSLLLTLLKRFGQDSLVPNHLLTRPVTATVVALASAYQSPFAAIRPSNLPDAINSLLLGLANTGSTDFACLYFFETEKEAIAAASKAGLLTTKLEANGVLQIPHKWTCLDDYFRSVRHGREHNREHRRFSEAGYRISWFTNIPRDSLNAAAELDHNFLQRKGHSLTQKDRLDWYRKVVSELPEQYTLAQAVGPDNRIVGTLMCLIDRNTLVPKAIGLRSDKEDFTYFNLAFYAPIAEAIKRRLTAVNFGPSGAKAKLRRGALPQYLMGAFWFPEAELRGLWPQLSQRLTQSVEAAWGGEKRGARP